VKRAEAKRMVLCKHLDGKALFIGLLCPYAAIYQEMHNSLQPDQEELRNFASKGDVSEIPQMNKPPSQSKQQS
jgi:hypothetical protein